MMRARSRVLKSISVAGLMAALTGCGGGGSTPAAAPPPTLTTTSLQTNENAALTQMLLASDPNGAAVTFAKASDPQHGTVTVGPDGTVTYTPKPYFHGTDSFTVRLTDALMASAAGQITVTVNYINYAPIAYDDQLRIPSASTTLPILANDDPVDGDSLTVSILTQPKGGLVSVTNGTLVTFQPENAFVGPTSFTYRITDPGGLSADATVRLVVGHFAGVVFLADETTPGTPELHLYDGLATVRLSTPLQSGAAIQSFTLAADNRHVAYVVVNSNYAQLLVADVTQPGSSQLLYTSTSGSGAPPLQFTLNSDASYALVVDPGISSALKLVLAHPVGGVSVLGASNPDVLQQFGDAFNPVSNEFYLQGQVGGSPPPMSGTGYTSLFAGTTSAPDPLAQIGSTYSGNNGGGSGNSIKFTPDGRRVLHSSVTYNLSPSSITYAGDLLVNDRATGAETYLYRKFGTYEFTDFSSTSYDVSPAGNGVCFVLNQLPVTGSQNRSQLWVADPTAPGTAAAVAPVADYNFSCRWAADSRSIVFQSANNGSPYELWVASATGTGAVLRLREPLAIGDSMPFTAVARTSMTALVAVMPSSSTVSSFYRAAIDAPGSSTLFDAVDLRTVSGISADGGGTSLVWIKGEPVSGGVGLINRLHWVSSQTSSYDLVLSRPDATVGVLQAAILP